KLAKRFVQKEHFSSDCLGIRPAYANNSDATRTRRCRYGCDCVSFIHGALKVQKTRQRTEKRERHFFSKTRAVIRRQPTTVICRVLGLVEFLLLVRYTGDENSRVRCFWCSPRDRFPTPGE